MPRRNFRELEARMSAEQIQESDTRVRSISADTAFRLAPIWKCVLLLVVVLVVTHADEPNLPYLRLAAGGGDKAALAQLRTL